MFDKLKKEKKRELISYIGMTGTFAFVMALFVALISVSVADFNTSSDFFLDEINEAKSLTFPSNATRYNEVVISWVFYYGMVNFFILACMIGMVLVLNPIITFGLDTWRIYNNKPSIEERVKALEKSRGHSHKPENPETRYTETS